MACLLLEIFGIYPLLTRGHNLVKGNLDGKI